MKTPRNKPQSEMTAEPNKYPQGKFKNKPCRRCQTEFSPKAPSHLYCSEECRVAADHSNYYKKAYGISYDEVLVMLENQNYLCAICKQVGFKMREDNKSSLAVDHCHATGAVRGLLCHNCNRALGLLQDNKEYLTSALKYLEGATTIP